MSSQKSFWQEQLTIKNLKIPRFVTAPMDGITDSPFRRLIRQYSHEELLFGEMCHVATAANNKNSPLLRYNPIEHPICFQFSSNRSEFVEKAIERVIAAGFDMIDLNAGCPAKRVIKSGAGSALMADIPRLVEILGIFKRVISERVPLSIKIRAGFKTKNALDVAMAAQDSGVNMLTIHPRTQPGGFTSPLDMDLVAKIKSTLSIPIIFSGNITSFKRAQQVYEATGVDGFMIGRALLGTPWKLKEITMHASGKAFTVKNHEAISCALKHLNLNLEHYGDAGMHKIKKQLPQYIRGVKNAAQLRNSLLRINSKNEMISALKSLLKREESS